MTGDGRAKRASLVKKRLSDITNSHPPSKSPVTEDCSVKEHIENLVKENLALANIIAEKNKIIELAGNEMHALRVNFQKMQVQNRTLALTNTHMLAELNLGKNKLKAFNHEISCKNGLIIAMNLELKEKVKANKIQKSCCSQPVEEETLVVNKCNEKGRTAGRPTARSQSMGSLLAKEILGISENKRRCLRRQSCARFKSREQEEEGEGEEEEGVEAQVGLVNNSPMMVSNKRKNGGGGESDMRRRESSMGIRPLRKATEKVHSYREIPLNVKMRRL